MELIVVVVEDPGDSLSLDEGRLPFLQALEQYQRKLGTHRLLNWYDFSMDQSFRVEEHGY